MDDEVWWEAIESRMRKVADSTQLLSRTLKESEPHIPWKRIAGFRNALTHEYHGKIDNDKVWVTIENHLPPLAEAAERMKVRTQAVLSGQSQGQGPLDRRRRPDPRRKSRPR